MKVSCLQENLARGMAIVGRAVATRSTLPVLLNVLLAAEQSRLKLAATNLELSIVCWVGARVEQEGAITVPARLLNEFIAALPPAHVEMELIHRTQTLSVRSGRFEANIRGIDAQEFPVIQFPEDGVGINLPAEPFAKLIDQVVFAAATEESRPVLTGVLAEIGPDQLTFAAADSYRMSVSSLPIEDGPEEPLSIIIPARALQEFRRIGGQQETVRLAVLSNRNQVAFQLPDITLLSQLVEGTFPNYRQIIPTSWTTRVTAGTEVLLQAVRMAAIFARTAANTVRFQVVPNGQSEIGRLIVSATSAEVGDSVSELEVKVEGEPLEIAFNARYLLDALGVIDTEQVRLEMRDSASAGVIRPAAESDFVHIVMPMQIAR